MRFLLYNIRYGTGGPGVRMPWRGYFKKTGDNLHRIIDFIKPLDPDVVGLVEVDGGSYRSGRTGQAQIMAQELGHYHTYRSKYREGARWARHLPVISKQGNAFLAKDTIANERFHYFTKGVKRLVIELELENLVIYLVHLALGFRIRQHQLSDLYDLVKSTRKPMIVAGDFNAFWGPPEINLFLGATGLVNANAEGQPTFPSWAPRRNLDFVLHSREIAVDRMWIPQVQLSDHLPMVFDFHINGVSSAPSRGPGHVLPTHALPEQA